MQTVEEKLAEMDALGKTILKEGFAFAQFSQACQLFWDVFLEDTNPFTEENLKFVSEEELERAIERQTTGDYRRMYELLPKNIRAKVTIEKMIEIESQGVGAFVQAFDQGTDPVYLGVYNHEDDICYVREDTPSVWDRKRNEFHAVIAAHELGHRYVRKKREAMNIKGIGNSFWEEKYCKWIEGGFQRYVFGSASKERRVEENIIWRKGIQTKLGSHIFNSELDKKATEYWIAGYKNN